LCGHFGGAQQLGLFCRFSSKRANPGDRQLGQYRKIVEVIVVALRLFFSRRMIVTARLSINTIS
jgi:hypothetical protein